MKGKTCYNCDTYRYWDQYGNGFYCKLCYKQMRRDYYLRNKTQILTKTKEYTQANPEPQAKATRKWLKGYPDYMKKRYKRDRIAFLIYSQMQHYMTLDGRW